MSTGEDQHAMRGRGATALLVSPSPLPACHAHALREGGSRWPSSHGLERVPTPKGSPGVSRGAAFLPLIFAARTGRRGYGASSRWPLDHRNPAFNTRNTRKHGLTCGNSLFQYPHDYPPTTRNYPQAGRPAGIEPRQLPAVCGYKSTICMCSDLRFAGSAGIAGFVLPLPYTPLESAYGASRGWPLDSENLRRNPAEPRKASLTCGNSLFSNPAEPRTEPRQTPLNPAGLESVRGSNPADPADLRGSKTALKHCLTLDFAGFAGFSGVFSAVRSTRSRFRYAPSRRPQVAAGTPDLNPSEPLTHGSTCENTLARCLSEPLARPLRTPRNPSQVQGHQGFEPLAGGVQEGFQRGSARGQNRALTCCFYVAEGFGGVFPRRSPYAPRVGQGVSEMPPALHAAAPPRSCPPKTSAAAGISRRRGCAGQPAGPSRGLPRGQRDSGTQPDRTGCVGFCHRVPGPQTSPAAHETTPDATTAKPSRPGPTPKEVTPV